MTQNVVARTAGSIVEDGARLWPDHTAVQTDETAWTYAQLERETARMRGALKRIGVQQGDHVATLMGPGPVWASVFFATLSLGAVSVPLNLTWLPTELTQGLLLTDSAYLIVETHFRGKDLLAEARRATAEPSTPLPRLAVHAIRAEGFEGSLPAETPELDPSGQGCPAAIVEPESIATLLLTSGSTSVPKPAMLSHRALTHGWSTYADTLEVDPSSTFLNYAPNYHVGGVTVMGMTLINGGRSLMMRWFDPDEAMRLIAAEDATHLWGFDTHFAMMRAAASYGQHDLTSVRNTIAASNVGAEAVEAFLEMGFTHHGSVYGSTEYMGQQAFFPPGDRTDLDRMKRSNGRPMSGELRIVDPDSGEIQPPNAPGEICVRGAALFSGYLNMPEETAACMDADGFFHSGDRGFLDQDGYLYFRGRYKEMVKTGGENVSMAEVEQFLLRHVPGMTHAVICGVPDKKWGESVTAAVVLVPGATTTAEEIRDVCRESLAGYKVPKHIVFLSDADWVVTPTGKVDRAAMRELTLQRLSSQSG